MDVVNTRCCGLDVHLKTVVACVLLTQDDSANCRGGMTSRTVRPSCDRVQQHGF